MTQLRVEAAEQILDAIRIAIDAIGGGFTMQYTTLATIATRIG